MKKFGKFLMGVVIIGALAAVITPRLMKEEPPIEAVPLPKVSVEYPVLADISLESGLIGTIAPSDIIYVMPKVAGDINAVYVSAGDMVKQGQALCRIDNSKQIENAKIQLDSALVSLQNAQTNLERLRILFETGDIPAQTYEQTEAQTKAAQLQYEAAMLAYNTQVEYSTVTAPISGTLESVNMTLHSTVAQSSQLCVITGKGVKKVTFSVPERLKQNLNLGDSIRLQKQGMEYTAVISEMANMISPQTGLFDIEATIGEGEALAAGSTVKLFVLSDYVQDAVTIPVDAVYYNGGDAYVYTCEGSTVHKIFVETGIFDEKRIEIRSGITLDDQVIVTWSSELYEGSQVNAALKTSDAQEETPENTEETENITESNAQ